MDVNGALTAVARNATGLAELIGALAVVAGGLVAGQPAAAAPAQVMPQAAPVITGLQRVLAFSLTDSNSPKSATAKCPLGKVVIGGGGRAFELTSTPTGRLTLTQLEPSEIIYGPEGIRQGYRVRAAETGSGTFFNWRVVAYAMCADAGSVSNIDIKVAATDASSDPVQATAAVCPSGQRALGSGARINNQSGHQVGLQVARASGTGDITRAQAHEDADGFLGNWNLVAFAVCADRPPGYEVKYGESRDRLSETVKTASAYCSGGRRLLGSGAAITNVAPGNVSLQKVRPASTEGPTEAEARENVPTSQPWDFIVAQSVCAFATN